MVSINIPDSLLGSFAFYSAVVLSKTMAMSLLTAFKRIKNSIYANPEDAATVRKPVVFNNETVERVRRNHLNDLENVLPFVLLGGLYLLTGPAAGTALWHFRIFAASRIAHTISYQLALPQPSRALTFFVGLSVNASMAYRILSSLSQFA
ncbi:hypothetical protein BOX15_Mlig014246g2 [Macrostomum lignano]|uniref:Microsomal glutathione S-transferase 1 n=2 Tax=Macrostomum lignano TaxID=282301 RepID=A0A1I8IWN2_9PLAT|nr:hypothetical protein BOX15_Mlig014246g3 [Macrostomum lignano]PAA65309.1 hypothetical protein BOX15_Mlig014246g1 [Macrostomum lignano]PAA88424.1 hypothetical protein BOX15_Mlig014246g2 [Macrostomum lignano]